MGDKIIQEGSEYTSNSFSGGPNVSIFLDQNWNSNFFVTLHTSWCQKTALQPQTSLSTSSQLKRHLIACNRIKVGVANYLTSGSSSPAADSRATSQVNCTKKKLGILHSCRSQQSKSSPIENKYCEILCIFLCTGE